MIIEEGINGRLFPEVTSWEIAKLEVTGTFIVKVYLDTKVIGITPYNPKTTVLMFNYEGHFDDEPIQTNGKRA